LAEVSAKELFLDRISKTGQNVEVILRNNFSLSLAQLFFNPHHSLKDKYRLKDKTLK